MKRILISISTVFAGGISNAQATNTENYIQTRVYLEPVTTSSSTARQIETVQYFDGLGRAKQVVNVKASPTGKDLVSHIEYDGFGRQVDSWLPAPMNTLNGGIQAGVKSSATTYYSDNFAFGHSNLEASPLDRVLSQVQPGTDWQAHPVTFNYDANVDGEVRKFTAIFNYTTFESKLTLSPSYGSARLYKNTVTDEDENTTIEYKNGQGQVLMVRKAISATENADTYYVYNDYDQLAYVIPPLAVEAVKSLTTGTFPDVTLNNLCYQYKYDGRNRLVEKKLPGKDWEYMVYDKADRLIATQDANLRSGSKWLVTKYDKFGRVIYTGIMPLPNQTRAGLQAITNNFVITENKSAQGFTMSGMQIYYTNDLYNQIDTILSVNYYDTYPPSTPSFIPTVTNLPLLTDDSSLNVSTKSLPVASYVKNIEDDNWTKNYTWYDQKGSPIGSHSINHLGGYTKTESELDFSGMAKMVVTKHKRLDSDPERVITENFTYDHQNRLKTHTHQVDSNPVEYLAQNEYTELSQLKNKKVGGTSLGSGLQQVDYTYNIRGWMTKINDPANLNGKFFGYEIKYNNPVYSSVSSGKFNGNIAEIDWKNSAEDILKRYNYTYDNLNRLKSGLYAEPNSTNPHNGNFDEYLTYDRNGNITNLQRTAVPIGGLTSTMVDNLDYQYTGNRLNRIVENALNDTGYEGGSNLISYDLNGNMTNMLDKGIQEINYNHLNLPNALGLPQINQFGMLVPVNLQYLYRADGTKLRKIYSTGGGRGQSTTNSIYDYLDGFQYYLVETIAACPWCRTEVAYEEQAFEKGGIILPPVDPHFPTLPALWVLDFVPTSEGFYSFTENRYIYQYRDHLGNARVNFAKNSEGILQVTDVNNYYPFGLSHIGGLKGVLGGYKNYKYNGKELQETGMYDYGARFYMPDIGRWGVIDPLAETSRRWSTYTYAYNNPINFIDPDGREGLGWGLKDNQWKFVDGMQKGDAAYQQGGYTDFRADGSVEPNVQITNSSAENTGLTYLGFNGDTSYMPTNSNGSVGMVGLSNWFRDAISDVESSVAGLFRTTNETFQVFTGGANETDPSTASKARGGDRLQTNDMFEQIFMFYGRNTQLTRGPIGFEEAFTQFGLDVEGIGNPFGGSSGSPSGSPSGATPIKSDTFGIWDRQATGILRNNDGSVFGLKYKNVRGEGLSKRTLDSLNKSIKDSNNYWNKQLRK